MIDSKSLISELRKNIEREKKALKEINYLYARIGKTKEKNEKRLINSQIKSLKKNLRESNDRATRNIKSLILVKFLPKIQEPIKEKAKVTPTKSSPQKIQATKTSNKEQPQKPEKEIKKPFKKIKRIKLAKELKPEGLEKETLKRLKKKEKVIKIEKKKKPSKYIKSANQMFPKFSKQLFSFRKC